MIEVPHLFTHLKFLFLCIYILILIYLMNTNFTIIFA